MFAGTHVFVRFGYGGGGHVYAAPAPGPAYTWVGGYYYPVGPRYSWHAGYWARPPYAHARWVAPRYYGHRYYNGYWRR
jgi:hypothetical protein